MSQLVSCWRLTATPSRSPSLSSIHSPEFLYISRLSFSSSSSSSWWSSSKLLLFSLVARSLGRPGGRSVGWMSASFSSRDDLLGGTIGINNDISPTYSAFSRFRLNSFIHYARRPPSIVLILLLLVVVSVVMVTAAAAAAAAAAAIPTTSFSISSRCPLLLPPFPKLTDQASKLATGPATVPFRTTDLMMC